jgi:hypothetical protein
MEAAGEEAIGSRVSAEGVAKVAAFSTPLFEVAKSRVVDGITTSLTSPLEVSSVCRGSG